MSISSSSYSPVSYDGDGSTDEFAYSFPVLAVSDLKVYLVAADGTSTLKTYETHYTATYGYSGGTVTMLTAPASGETLTLTRETALTQPTDYRNQGTFYPETLERSLDRLCLQLQEVDQTCTTASAAYTTETMPSVTAGLVGTIIQVGTAPTYFYIGAKNADATYSWVLLAQGAF